MKTLFYPVHFLLAMLVGVTACGTGSPSDINEDSIDLCSNPALAGFEEEPFSITLPEAIKWNGEGDETNFDFDLGIIYLAASSVGPDDEAIGTLTLLFDQAPIQTSFRVDEERRLVCGAAITSGMLSTNDARRGPGPEMNPKLYARTNLDGVCEYQVADNLLKLVPGIIEFFYVSNGSAHGWACLMVEEVSPGSGEPFLILATFAIRNYRN